MVEELQDKELADCKLDITFVAWIPKKGAQALSNFRLISLLRSMYKVLAKVLARRMTRVPEGVTYKFQNAFLKGQQILDCSLIAYEKLGSWIKEREGGMIFKVDMLKAYDHMSWNFDL